MPSSAASTYVGKRILDLSLATGAFVLGSPILLLVAGSIVLLSGQSPIFVQERVGQHERIFRLYKFRTLAFGSSWRARWATRWGFALRKYSLDELPQLWNVIRGDMSLVGPRPLLVEYLPYYSEAQRRRHWAKPGITGWAQVHGRNSLDWPERFALDGWYVAHTSLRLDIKILMMTLRHLIAPRIDQIRPEGLSDNEKFRGS